MTQNRSSFDVKLLYVLIIFGFLTAVYFALLAKQEIEVVKKSKVVYDAIYIDSVVTANNLKIIDSLNTKIKTLENGIQKLERSDNRLRDRIDNINKSVSLPNY